MSVDKKILETFENPVIWCQSYLRDPRDREKPLLLRSYQKEVLQNSRSYQNIILQWGRRMGKCLRGNSLILNELGELIKVDSQVNKSDLSVISLDNNLNFSKTKEVKCISNGKKSIYKLLTKSGRRIETTENHPFLTPNGWKWLKELEVGKTISIPSKIDLNLKKEIYDFQVKMIAYLLSDGCITQYIKFGNKIDKIKNEFKEIVSYFNGCKCNITKKINNYEEYYVTGEKTLDNKRNKNSLIDYMRLLGLFGKNSYTKFIPNEIMQLSKKQQALFLSRLYACDGWASVSKSNRKSGNCEIGYCSVSEELAYGVAHLLMRFGIRYFITEKNIKYKRTIKKAFQICIRGKKDILKFINDIGIFGKEESCEKVKNIVESRIDKETYFDSVPFELIEAFKIPTSREIKKAKRVSKFKVIDYAKQNKLYDLLQICESDTFFDEIESINYIGEEETYDLEVYPYHNFIANDIIVHNSVAMCADCLWWASVYPVLRMIENKDVKTKPFTILIFTPYESQIKELWNTFIQLIGDSPLLKDQVKKIRCSDIHSIEFKGQGDNPGSIIKGYTIGVSSSNQGTSLRGLSGDMIFIDEMDFIPTDIIEQVIMPITTTHPDCKRRICSTPSGARDLYFKWCSMAKELGWFHTHYPSWHPDNDNWMSIEQAKEKGIPIYNSTEFQVKSVTSSDNYIREYGAEFGEEYGGVYKHHLINKCLVKYGRNIDVSDPNVFDPGFTQNPEHKYIIGVDWNSYINGGQIVVLEFCTTPTYVSYFDDDLKIEVIINFTGKYRLFYRKSIKSKDATQRLTRLEIIRLLTYYKIDFLYVDYGAGDTNIEELSLYGRQHPELNLNQKLRVIDSGATVEHYDHVIQKMVKKRNKSLMINFSVLSLEEEIFILPKEEDYNTKLIGQMRNYVVKHVTTRGEYAYEGEDHILDAFNLAVYGFQQNFGQLLTSRTSYSISLIPSPRIDMFPRRESTVQCPIKLTTFKNNGTYNTPIIDPEKTTPFQRPRRGFLPGINSRQNINSPNGHSRRGF